MRRLVLVLLVLLAAALPASTQCIDVDGDGYGNPGDPSCLGGAAVDCNDAAAATYLGAPETCDGYDNDCDSQLDEAPNCEPVCPSMIQLADAIPVSAPYIGLLPSYSLDWLQLRDRMVGLR